MDLPEAVGMAADILGTGWSIGKDITKALPTDRRCTVHIKNDSSNYTLHKPCVHTKSGRCFIPFPPFIPPSGEGKALFAKVPNTARGSVGIFTFRLQNNVSKESDYIIAIMYKVPFDLNRKSVEYALGVFSASTECNQELFHEMSKNTNTTFVRGKAKGPSLTHKSDTVTIMATMSDCYTPHMKVIVSDS